MKIHIMGASCAGSTTLGVALSDRLGSFYFDTDYYFWEPSDPPFTIRRNADERDEMIKQELAKQNDWVVGGSVIQWGSEWKHMFDLVVFLYVPSQIRMQRLKDREFERYGNNLFANSDKALKSEAFINWAKGYDDNTASGRNLKAHESWLEQLTCPIIRIEGDTTVQKRLDTILSYLNSTRQRDWYSFQKPH